MCCTITQISLDFNICAENNGHVRETIKIIQLSFLRYLPNRFHPSTKSNFELESCQKLTHSHSQSSINTLNLGKFDL